MKLKLFSKLPWWVILGGIVVVVFLFFRGSKLFESFQTSHAKRIDTKDPNPNAPDTPVQFVVRPSYNFSTNQVDVAYTIGMNQPVQIAPDGYKIYLCPLPVTSPPPPGAILLDTIPYQNTPTIQITRSYPPSEFPNSVCTYEFAVWSYKDTILSNGTQYLGSPIAYNQRFTNLPATQASYDPSSKQLKIISSGFSQYPCLVYMGGIYAVTYVVRTSLDGNNWSSPVTGGALPDDLTADVMFVPASTTQTSYVQIAAWDMNTNTTISPWSSTITVPA